MDVPHGIPLYKKHPDRWDKSKEGYAFTGTDIKTHMVPVSNTHLRAHEPDT